MLKNATLAFAAISALTLSGCETTNSIPYKASTANVISIQQKMKAQNKDVSIDTISMASGVDESLVCRLMGPVKVAPGKTLSQYIQDAFQEELFMAQVYRPDSPNAIKGSISKLSFSSVAPANWTIAMDVSSNHSKGYSVEVKYPFNTSFSAYSACKNVADAFGPAVQRVLKEVVDHPDFITLAQ